MTVREVNARLTSYILKTNLNFPPKQKTNGVKRIRLEVIRKILGLNYPINSTFDLTEEQVELLSSMLEEQYVSKVIKEIVDD